MVGNKFEPFQKDFLHTEFAEISKFRNQTFSTLK